MADNAKLLIQQAISACPNDAMMTNAVNWPLLRKALEATAGGAVETDANNQPYVVGADGRPVLIGTNQKNTAVHAGDSRAAQGFVDETITAGNYTGGYTSRNWYQWLVALAGQPLRLIQSAGVGGDTTTLFVARQNNAAGGSLFGKLSSPGWVQHRPGWLFMSLGINDVTGGVPTAASIANARLILSKAQQTRTIVVWPTETPVGPAGTQLGASAPLLAAWNSELQGLRSEFPNLIVPDCYTAFIDPATGLCRAGLHNDSSGIHVHYNNAGALLFAQTVYSAIANLLPSTGFPLASNASELISSNPSINQYQVNPLFSGATVTDALQSAIAFGAGATGTATLIPDPLGYGNAIQVDVTYTGASSAYTLLGLKQSASNFVGGESVVGAVHVRCGAPGAAPGALLPLDASRSVRVPEHLLNITDAVAAGGTANSRQSLMYSTNDAGLVSGFDLVSLTPAYKLKAGVPQSVQQMIYLRGTAAGSGPVRWIVSQPTIRRIPEFSDAWLPFL